MEQDLTQLAAEMLELAKKQGADGAEVIIADGETFSVQVRLSAVERLTKAREKRLCLRVFIGKRSASASTSDFSREALRRLVSDTC
ncbi:MAG: PmbA/TldA family metallopeptidase, partial [Nitrospiraceae bacterium]